MDTLLNTEFLNALYSQGNAQFSIFRAIQAIESKIPIEIFDGIQNRTRDLLHMLS